MALCSDRYVLDPDEHTVTDQKKKKRAGSLAVGYC